MTTEERLAANIQERPHIKVEIKDDEADDIFHTVICVFEGEITKSDQEIRQEEAQIEREGLEAEKAEVEAELETKRAELAEYETKWQNLQQQYYEIGSWTFEKLCDETDSNTLGAYYIYMWFKHNLGTIYTNATSLIDYSTLPERTTLTDIEGASDGNGNVIGLAKLEDYPRSTLVITPDAVLGQVKDELGIGEFLRFHNNVSGWSSGAETWIQNNTGIERFRFVRNRVDSFKSWRRRNVS